MAQFGAGTALAAQCPIVSIPDGWRNWTDADGPVPDALAKRAQAIAADATVPLGATESYPLPGVMTLIRLEPRVWSRDAQGNLVEGCFRTAGIFLPSGAPDAASITAPASDKTSKIIAWLTGISLAVGTAATIATWKGRRG